MKTQINEIKRMQQLAGIINESQLNKFQLNETIELEAKDFGPEWDKITKELFGDGFKTQDTDASYRPSTDTGGEPHLTLTWSGNDYTGVKDEDWKNVTFWTSFQNGKGEIVIRPNAKNKEAWEKEVETKLIPVWKKASVFALNNLIKNPEDLTKATIGGGYKYEEKDQESLNKFVSEIPSLSFRKG